MAAEDTDDQKAWMLYINMASQILDSGILPIRGVDEEYTPHPTSFPNLPGWLTLIRFSFFFSQVSRAPQLRPLENRPAVCLA